MYYIIFSIRYGTNERNAFLATAEIQRLDDGARVWDFVWETVARLIYWEPDTKSRHKRPKTEKEKEYSATHRMFPSLYFDSSFFRLKYEIFPYAIPNRNLFADCLIYLDL